MQSESGEMRRERKGGIVKERERKWCWEGRRKGGREGVQMNE